MARDRRPASDPPPATRVAIKRLFWLLVAGLAGSIAAIAAIGRLGRDWEARVAVRGHSMEPTLIEGDWLLVDALAYERRAPAAGELVVADDPRAPGRTVIKRAVEVLPDGSVRLAGDHPGHAGDEIGAVPPTALTGKPWFRYWPPGQFGPIH